VTGAGGTETKHLRDALISLGIVGSALIVYFLHWDSAADFSKSIDHGTSLFLDFKRYYYPAGENIFTESVPPRGYVYTPFFALCLAPLARFSPQTATYLWGIFQAALVLVTLIIPAKHLASLSRSSFYLYVALVALSFPYIHNFRWGQVSVLIFATVLGALYLYRSGRKYLSAVVLALGASVKLYTIVFIVYFALKREWRYLALFGALLVSLALVLPIAALGLGDTIGFYREVGSVLRDAQSIFLRDVNSQSFPNVFSRAFRHLLSAEQLVYLRSIGIGVFAISCWMVRGLIRRNTEDDAIWGFALILLSLPFVVSSSWPHYFVYLPYLQAFFVGDLLAKGMTPARTTVLTFVLLPSIAMSSMLIFFKVGQWYGYASDSYLFLANLLLLLYAWGVSLARREGAEASLNPAAFRQRRARRSPP
jgi:alpha-1,2-mannosyltransferase